jgi:hypothetical protein
VAKEADKTMTLGPFKGGLNLQSDPTDMSDDQLAEALNFDTDPNGALKSRPPFVSAGPQMDLGVSGNAKLLGFYYTNAGGVYLFASDGLSKTYVFSGGVWTLVTSNFAATAMAQFDGKAWLVAPTGSANPSGSWTPSGGFVADADMPKGADIAVYKDRLWVASGKGSTSPTSMFYSKLIVEGTIWASAASREVQVSPGDGQSIVALRPYYGALLVFRNQSIYSYSYATSTAAATIAIIAPGIGLATRECLVAYESYLYFMYDDKAYEFVGNRAQRINQQVPFRAGDATNISMPFAVSTFGKRVLFAYYDYLYVFNIDRRAWTRWNTTAWGAVAQVLEPIPGTSPIDAFALPSKEVPLGGSRKVSVLKISETLNASDDEDFTCILQTKNYSFDVPSAHKRMWWWGADAVFRDTVRGIAHPIVQTQSTDWGVLWTSGVTWADLLSSTWAAPVGSDAIIDVETEYDTDGLGFLRKFVKMKKAMRFRQVYFRVEFTADGTINTSPVYLFTLRAKIAVRQFVTKAIS